MFKREAFALGYRVVGAGRHSLILRDNSGEVIYCSNKLFNKLMTNPDITFQVVNVAEHEDPRTGRFYPESKWIQALIPTRF
jgi:hypothetical protein